MAVLPKQGVETAAKDVAAVAVHYCWGRVGDRVTTLGMSLLRL